jgi:hypothetical protein
MSEHHEQAALFAWAAVKSKQLPELALMFAIPNGAKCSFAYDAKGQRFSNAAMKLKAEGLKAGVFDIFLPVPRGKHHGLFIEMKAEGRKLSEEQCDFEMKVMQQGYETVVISTGWEAARDFIERYLRK